MATQITVKNLSGQKHFVLNVTETTTVKEVREECQKFFKKDFKLTPKS